MDNITRVSTLVGEVLNRPALFDWWALQQNTPSIPRYWTPRGSNVVLKVFGSRGNVTHLAPYTSILSTKQKMIVKGWIATSRAIILLLDPTCVPTDLQTPYLILYTQSDRIDPDLVLHALRTSEVHHANFNLEVKIGYSDPIRNKVRFDLPGDLK
jgi:hypothetical protein